MAIDPSEVNADLTFTVCYYSDQIGIAHKMASLHPVNS